MSWPEIVELPDASAAQIVSGTTRPRYEDVAQDGRVRLEGIWPPIGPILWDGERPVTQALTRLGARGIRSVLSRVVLFGGSEPISVRNLVSHELRFDFAHGVDEGGNVDRIFFDTWLSSRALRGIPGDPGRPSPKGGPEVEVARAYGQHVFTRPTAPAGQHRVYELEDPELPRVPERRDMFVDARSLIALPSGAEPLEPELAADAAPIAFGLAHTDGNQHVNFLAYPRLVEDATLRRLSELGLGSRLLARFMELSYRKPCFAGDRVRVLLRAFRHGDGFGAVAAFVPEGSGASLDKPHVTARILLAP